MKIGYSRYVLLVASVSGVASCAGDGTGLDEFGNPLGESRVELAPTLASIQANIFTPICTKCHIGASAPLGLVLSEGVARKNLVFVPSVEMSELMRVNPGKPDSSYIIWKIEGRSAIMGARMPFQLPPLSAEYIDAVRGWIEAGALEN
ncbi:MAG: hypothetical protein ACE5HT_04205 [Gemmatimonadales bacterium]